VYEWKISLYQSTTERQWLEKKIAIDEQSRTLAEMKHPLAEPQKRISIENWF
jgi:hypothetical protein